MAWYSVGSVTVTNTSSSVTGVGTNFTAVVKPGHIFYGPDKALYEVLNVVSDTQLTLSLPYDGTSVTGTTGATAATGAYAVIPTQGMVPSLVTQVQALIGDYANIHNTVGSGKFNSGTNSAPGIAFNADQDSGAYMIGQNSWALVCGGLAGLSLTPTINTLNYSSTPKVSTSAIGAEVTGTLTATALVVGPVTSGATTVTGTLAATEVQVGVHTMTNLAARIAVLEP